MNENQVNNEHAKSYDTRPWLSSYPSNMLTEIPALRNTSLVQFYEEACRKFDLRTASTVCLDNGLHASLTFRDLRTLSEQFARYLKDHASVRKGDRVALQMPNCLAYAVAVFGVLKAGGIVVNTNPLYTEREMIHQFSDSGSSVLVIMDLFQDKLEKVIPQTTIKNVVTVSMGDLMPMAKSLLIKTVLRLKKKVPSTTVTTTPFSVALSLGAAVGARRKVDSEHEFPESTLEDVALLQYTGGTTGVSKGVMLTHANILSNIQQMEILTASAVKPGEDVVMTALPLYHIFAFTVNLMFFVGIGGQNILIPSPRPISNLRKAFEKFPISWMSGVNTIYNALLNEPWFVQNPPKSLRVIVGGGAAMLKPTCERWKKVTGTNILEAYGLSESSPGLTMNPFGIEPKYESIGMPWPGTLLRCVDDNGNPVAPGEPGEIVAKGPQVMKGYWNRPQDTAKTLKDGWLFTGDVGVMEANGYFRIVDRKKDMIIVSGFNVYPNEIEAVIAELPDVLEVAVVGVPDEKSGEAVRAFVVRKSESLTEDQIKEHCRKVLTAYKVPKQVEFRADLPKTPIGKILRRELRPKA